jgi:uncharacterized phage protein gp47/JayE
MAIDYTRRDYNTIKNALLDRASSVLPEWTDRDTSDFGMLFVDLWSYMGDVLHYYIDRAAGESFLNTATQRESVLAIANLLDYTPSSRTAAYATVFIENTSDSTEFTIPSGTILLGPAVTCYTTEEVVISPNNIVSVTVYEGSYITKESIGTSTGNPSQRISLPVDNVVSNSIRLFVREDGENDTEYRYVNSLSEGRFGERVFSTYTDAEKYTQVILGNSINGFIPPANSTFFVSYATSSGALGNYGINSVTSFKRSTSSSLRIASSYAFVGGSDEESIDSLRVSIPLKTRPQDRAVTLDDFIDLALSTPGVYKASATYSSPSAAYASGSVTIYPVPMQSDYSTTTAASIPVPVSMQNVLVDTIQPKALLGVNVYVANKIDLIPVNITADVHVNDRYITGWVISDVYNALSALFSFDSVSLGQRLSLSEIYKTIISVEGVDYAEIDGAEGGVFSSTLSGVSQSISASSVQLLRKGTITLNAYGGITTGDV